MKVAIEEREISSHGIKSSKNYTIKATAKAFKILSSSLYKNKIKAIVRELSCNAYDAHVAIGNKTLAFEIHAPTQLEPHFGVRDFGPGLNQDEIEEIYTTYFLSTKSDSNDYIGALGLGSKSPFSYVDSYTTISRYNGKKYTYIAAMDEHGEPSLNLLSTVECDEPNGLEVIVPVSLYDFNLFKNEIENIFRWFVTKPIINLSNLNIQKPKSLIEGKDWFITNDSTETSGVIMGNVMYPLDLNQIDNVFLKCLLSNRNSLYIHANIGDVDITAGREDLSYDKSTKQWLNNKISQIKEEYIGVVGEQIKNAPNLRAAHIIYEEMYSSFSNTPHNFVYNGKKINNRYALLKFDFFDNETEIVFRHFDDSSYKHRYHTYSSKLRPDLGLFITKSMVFLFDDETKGNNSKFKYWMKYRKWTECVVFPIKCRELILNEFSGWEEIIISELPSPPRQTYDRQPRQKNLVLIYNPASQECYSKEIDLNSQKGFLLNARPLKRDTYVSFGKYLITKSHFNEIWKQGFSKEYELIIPSKTVEKKIKNNTNWRPIEIGFDEFIEKFLNIEDNIKKLKRNNSKRQDMWRYDFLKTIDLPKNHIIKYFVSNTSENDSVFLTSIMHAIKQYNPDTSYLKEDIDGDIFKEIMTRYPLLSYINHADKSNVKKYIEQCDYYEGKNINV